MSNSGKKKKGKKVLVVLVTLAVIVAVFTAVLAWYFFAGQPDTEMFKITSSSEQSQSTEAAAQSNSTDQSTEQTTEPDSAATEQTNPTVDNGNVTSQYIVEYDEDGNEYYTYTSIPVSFENMKEINSDLYAWIYIPGTQIDYPIAQASDEDDSFYLSHDIYKNYSIYGTIYTEKCNSKDFNDPNTLIYGHEMLNGSMFQNLHYYEDEEYFNNNPYFYIFTEDRVLTYRIFSAFQYDDRHIMYSFDFTQPDEYQSFLNEAMNPQSSIANVREGVEVTTDDKIVTLSTCDGSNSENRYLVCGVLISDQTIS